MVQTYSVVKTGGKTFDAIQFTQAKETSKRLALLWRAFQSNGLGNAERAEFLTSLQAIRAFRSDVANQSRLAYTHTLKRNGLFVSSVKRTGELLGLEYRRELVKRLREEIRQYRRERNPIQYPQNKSYEIGDHHFTVQVLGLVHVKPGSILKLAKDLKKRRVKQSKRPQSSVKHVGIEIEFCSASNDAELTDALAEAGLDRYVTLKGDGSVVPDDQNCECNRCPCCNEVYDCECSSSDHGHEINILASQRRFAEIVKRVCAVLDAHGAYVNKTCGLHVHLDIRTRDASRVFSNLVRSYSILSAMVPKQRRENSFCAPPRGSLVAPRDYSGRYWAINPQSIQDHKTVEIRVHAGTTNAMKIIRWTRLLVAIADCTSIATHVTTTASLFRHIEISAVLQTYVLNRIKKFQGNVNSNLGERAA